MEASESTIDSHAESHSTSIWTLEDLLGEYLRRRTAMAFRSSYYAHNDCDPSYLVGDRARKTYPWNYGAPFTADEDPNALDIQQDSSEWIQIDHSDLAVPVRTQDILNQDTSSLSLEGGTKPRKRKLEDICRQDEADNEVALNPRSIEIPRYHHGRLESAHVDNYADPMTPDSMKRQGHLTNSTNSPMTCDGLTDNEICSSSPILPDLARVSNSPYHVRLGGSNFTGTSTEDAYSRDVPALGFPGRSVIERGTEYGSEFPLIPSMANRKKRRGYSSMSEPFNGLDLAAVEAPKDSDYASDTIMPVNMRFSQSSKLIVPIACPKGCKATFKRRCDLKMHMKTHEKPCKCSTCHKGFPLQRDKQRHEDTHRQLDRPSFSCPSCGSRLSREDSLKRHQKKMHSRAEGIP